MMQASGPSDAAGRWRSLLFVPAHSERLLSRAHERGADALILDLEDAVPPAEKDRARAGPILVRINSGIRAVAADLEAAVVTGVSALVVPKAESADWVAAVGDAVTGLERERGLRVGAIGLVLQIETPAALSCLPALASADPRVAAMTVGPEDLCAALGATPGPDALLGPNVAVLCAEGTGREPARLGLEHPSICPYGAFPTADGSLVLISIQNEREWAAFCAGVLDDPALPLQPGFEDNNARVANRAAVNRIVAAALGRLSRAEAAERLRASRTPFGFVNSLADLAAHPALRRVEVGIPGGTASIVAPPGIRDGAAPVLGPVPAIGEHSDAIRAQFRADAASNGREPS